MNEKQTIHSKAAELKARRIALREQGICIHCTAQPATLNKDGTQSVCCADCKANQAKRKMRSPGRSFSVSDAEMPDYRDAAEFRNYRERVMTAMQTASEPMTYREIRNAIGDRGRYPQQWVADSLDLMADVQEVKVLPTRYYIDISRRKPDVKIKYGAMAMVRR